MARKTGVQAYVEPIALEKLYEAFPEISKQDTVTGAAEIATRLSRETGISNPDLLNELVEQLIKARKYTLLMELRGKFSREELHGMLNAFNGSIVRGINIPARDLLEHQMQDAEYYDKAGAFYGYDTEVLLEKIRQLTHAQAEIWLLEIRVFWEELSQRENGLEEWLGEYGTKK